MIGHRVAYDERGVMDKYNYTILIGVHTTIIKKKIFVLC